MRAWSPDGGVMNVHQTMSAISQVSSQQSVSGRWVSNSSPSVSALSLGVSVIIGTNIIITSLQGH